MKRGMPAILLLPWLLSATGETRADDTTAFFESRIRPVLARHCYECHSDVNTKGGLALDTKQGWEKGGDAGPAIVPGQPGESPLIRAIRYEDEDLRMPPKKKGGKLPDAVIADLVEWVRMGAPDPRVGEAKIAGMKEEEARTWWAFQPLAPADPAREIDSFLDEKIAEKGLAPAPTADPRPLIRRVTYDLTGLPPTAEEVDAFVEQSAREPETAYQDLVERLLASPQYGVQWGRKWLDVVRYADTAGENTDRPLPHAWRYRNWVIDAFNRDLRYDEFVRLQLAGDILRDRAPSNARREGIIATGYLAIARRFGHDIDKDMHLTTEDVLDTLGKNFLGLTIGCARCHDHKYDPITARDYYALYGFFESTRFAFPGCEPKGQPRDMVPLMPPDEVEVLMKPWHDKVAALEEQKKARLEAAKATSEKLVGALEGVKRNLFTAPVAEGASVPFEHHLTVRRGEVVQLSVLPGESHGADSTLLEWNIQETGGARRRWSTAELVDELTLGNPHPGAHGAEWCFIEVTGAPVYLTDLRHGISGNSSLKAWSLGGEPSVFVNASDQQVMAWTTLAAKSFFVHPGVNRPVAVAWVSPMEGEITLHGRVADAHPAALDGVSFAIDHFAAPEAGPALAELGRFATAALPDPGPEPVIPVAYAVAEAAAKNTRFHQRGDPEKPGDEVPRRWLSVFGGQPLADETGSGREELAEWIVQHPLSARVMVNRLWEWHFGRGLVRSSNDYGSRGEPPTHPELLDWLAIRFVESGYSVKTMHRLILATTAYRRASAAPRAEDPANSLFSHFNRRRLTAEELRDTVLNASGRLDLSPAEAHPFPPEETWGFTQHAPFNAVYETNKRSAYLMVQRQQRHPFLSLFDGADPNATTAARQITTVPTQALYFINDPFFHEQAAVFAGPLMNWADETERVVQAWRVLFQRQPSGEEIARVRRFLASYPAPEEEKWPALARVLMASNEFLHLD